MNNGDLNKTYEKIKKLLNAGGKPLLSDTPQELKVRLLTDESISPGMFKPSKIEPNTYYATSLTIRAVKKDLFLCGQGFEDIEDISSCASCNRDLDRQFWKFCPYCEGKIS